MKILILYLLLLIPVTMTAQDKTKDQDIDSKAKELGISSETLRNMLNSAEQKNLQDPGDPHPDVMNRTVLSGPGIGFYAGCVASAGDVNGDGFNDIIVGAGSYNTFTGKAFLYYGGNTVSSTPDITFIGESTSNLFGYSVSSAGDVNSDGYSDIIIGAPWNSSNTGKAYIYFGGASMNTTADVTMTGESSNNNFGWSVSASGDVNGDGYSDVIIGAYGYSVNTGRSYIYYGGSLMNNIADVTMTGEFSNDQFGYSVSGAGDLNNDGYYDVICGAKGYSSSTGRSYAYFGGASMNNTADVTMTGEGTNNSFGGAVSSAGDFNADGYSDVIVGAYDFNSSAGRAYVFFGGGAMDNVTDVTLNGETLSLFGTAVSYAGDVNGDSYSDILIGGPSYSTSTGRAYIYYGGPGYNISADRVLTGDASNDLFGRSVSNLGDVNNDGSDDFIIGAPNTNKAYIYRNSMSGTDTPSLRLFGEASNSSFGYSLASAGDVNSDGFEDILVGAYNYSSSVGRAYIYFGGTLMDAVPDVTFISPGPAFLYFAGSVSGAGDVNGDGYDDVIIGAEGYNSFTGRAYIYYGGASMDNTIDVTLTGTALSFFGNSVSGGKDVNNDGFSDVLVGSYGFNSNQGRAQIFYGGSSMDLVADATMLGENANDNFGIGTALTDDINGDGAADFMVSASGFNTNTGKIYIYYGGSLINSGVDVTYTGLNTNDYFGRTISSAGDINGDGYNDLMAGMSRGSGGINYVFVYYGATQMSPNSSFTITAGIPVDFLGALLSPAGDVNGDGYDDIIIGNYSGSNYTGRSYVYFGGNTPHTIPDITFNAEAINERMGYNVAAGDFNGDGYSDLLSGASLYNNSTGRVSVFMSSPPPVKPSLLSVRDIPNDQGGKVLLKWNKSGYQQSGIVTSYDVYRSPAPSGGVYSWQLMTNVTAGVNSIYSYNADTYNDSTQLGTQKTYFKIVARTSTASQFWTSNILSGYSIDNLAPLSPNNLAATPASNKIDLNWDNAYAPDVAYYKIYRNGAEFAASNTSQYSDNAVTINSDYTYKVSAVDIHGNESDLSNPVTTSIAIKLSLKMFLEGSYSGGLNSTGLITGGLLPLSTPYATGEAIQNSFLTAHSNICDWIRLDLRLTQSGSIAASRSVFLLSDGSILDTNGAAFCTFYGVASGNYYVVVNHRNHLSVMTASFAALSTISINYDFSTGLNKYFGNDAKSLSGGAFGMYSGDGNQDGSVDNTDRNLVWRPSNGQSGYLAGDFNLDGAADNIDKNIKWRPNNGKATWVP